MKNKIGQLFVIVSIVSFIALASCKKAGASNEVSPAETLPDVPTPDLQGTLVYVTASQLKVRAKPDAKADVLGLLNKGDNLRFLAHAGESITVEGITSDWLEMKYGDSRGFVFAGFTSPEKPMLVYTQSQLIEIEAQNRAYQEELNEQERRAQAATEARGEMYQNCDPCPHYKVDVHLEEAKVGCTKEKKARIKKLMEVRNIRLYEAGNLYGDGYCSTLISSSPESGSQCSSGPSFFQ